MIPQLQTPRLYLRPVELADAQQTQPYFLIGRLFATSQTLCPGALSTGRCSHLLSRRCASSDGPRRCIALDPEGEDRARRLIGNIGLKEGENTNRGFWLGLPWQGEGLMTEACEAVTDFWFNTLQMRVLRVPKAVANGTQE